MYGTGSIHWKNQFFAEDCIFNALFRYWLSCVDDGTVMFPVKETAVNPPMYGNKRGIADNVRFVINWPHIIRMYPRVWPSALLFVCCSLVLVWMLAHAEAFLEKADGTNIDSILSRRYELILSKVSELPIDTETNEIYRSVYVALIAPCRWKTVVTVFFSYDCTEIFMRKKDEEK